MSANHCAAGTELAEAVHRPQQFWMALDEGESLALEELVWAGLAVAFDELGLVVEQIELRGGARHVEENDMLGPGGERGGMRRQGRGRARRRGG